GGPELPARLRRDPPAPTRREPAAHHTRRPAGPPAVPGVRPAAYRPPRGRILAHMSELMRLRAWWARRQGLDGSLAGASAAEVLALTGWARSVGGSAPYLGLHARAGLDRAVVDAAVARLEVHELPSARGCTYVLPAADFALGLTVGAGAPEADIAAAGRRLGVTRTEIDELG